MGTEDEAVLFPLVEYLEVGVGVSNLCLINAAASVDDAFLLVLVAGFVIKR